MISDKLALWLSECRPRDVEGLTDRYVAILKITTARLRSILIENLRLTNSSIFFRVLKRQLYLAS